MQPAQTFLETILPETGVYCAIHFVHDARAPQGKRAVHEWTSTPAEAAALITLTVPWMLAAFMAVGSGTQMR